MVEMIRDHKWWNQKGRMEADKHDPWSMECYIETRLFEEECTFYLSEGVGGVFHAWQESEFEKMQKDARLIALEQEISTLKELVLKLSEKKD